MDDDTQYDPQTLEDEIEEFWESKSIDKKVDESREGDENFYLARPPISTKDYLNWDELYMSIVYDVWSRYKNMQHLHVRTGFGLDPLNARIEKLSIKEQGMNYLETLTDDKTLEILSEMEDRSRGFIESNYDELHKLGLWMPSEFDYETTSGEFIDSIWWSFKELMDKDLLVKKKKPVRWCPNCRISPSVSEISVKEEDREKIFIKVPLASGKNRYFLLEIEEIWMLPAGITIAVNPKLKYAVVKIDSGENISEQFVILEKNLETIMDETDIDEYEVLNTIDGDELEDLSFKYPLGDKILEKTDLIGETQKVLLTEKVSDDGTGFDLLVPEYKKEHWQITEENDLDPYNPILKNGYFDGGPRQNKYSGLSISESESVIVDDLKTKDLLLAKKKMDKKVEMCDICRSRLIRYPMRGWFFEASQIEGRLQEGFEDLEILPSADHILSKDWLLSRDNRWGVPLPRWECHECGTIFIPSERGDLAERSNYEISQDMTPETIINTEVDCRECGELMKREKKILDPSFVHACSPWAQLGYPKQEEGYESLWPSKVFFGKKFNDDDLLSANLSLSFALFDEPSSEKSIYLGPVSSEIEYQNVENLISKNGYDSLRLYLLSGEPPWVPRKVTKSDLEFSHRVPRVAWNLNKFFEENIDDLEIGLDEISSSSFKENMKPEDSWILSKLENVKEKVEDHYDQGRFDLAVESLEEFIMKDVAQSYIKRCRTRLDEGNEEEKLFVMKTSHRILDSISKLLSPVTPFIAENIYQSLNRRSQSVFLEDWPERDESYVDQTLESMMEDARNIVEEIMNLKGRYELPDKWPLRKIVYKAKNQNGEDLAEKFADFIKNKAIVKDIEILGADEEWDEAIFKAEPNREVIADSYERWVKKIETILRQKSSEKIKEGIEKGGFEIGLEGRIIEIDPDMISLKREVPEGFQEISLDDQDIFVDLEVTEGIWDEEMVKEIVLRLKSMRKDLEISEEDEIEVYLDSDKDVIEVVEKNRNEIEEAIGARVIRMDEVDMDEAQYVLEWDINGMIVDIGIKPLYRRRMIDYYSSISGINRSTAELLYESGYTTLDSVRDVNPSQLTKVKDIGSKLAENILHFVEKKEMEEVVEVKKEKEEEIVESEEEKEEEEALTELPDDISKSSTYLIEEKTSERSFKLLKKILETGEEGLCVTRDYPDKVKKEYGLEDIEMIWLSNVDREDVIRPKSLEKLSLALENFLARTGGVILLNGLEYVITNNDFRTVLNLIQSIKDQVAINESIMLIPVNPSIMEEYQIDQLSGVVDNTLEDQT